MANLQLRQLVDSVLGRGKQTSGDNIAYTCPFCHHHKPKLEVNLSTYHWHCWVCNQAGRKLVTLFKRLSVDKVKMTKLFDLIEEHGPKRTIVNESTHCRLPDEYKPLWIENRQSPEFRNAFAYLIKRGVTVYDMLKYRIGYCDSGEYSGKVIVPSYDNNGFINYFVSRAYYENDTRKYKNPQVSKNIIGFELFINWNLPVVLVEGVFDAIAIKRNAIPLFGKTINEALRYKIIENEVKQVYICLDKDARKQAIATADYFMANGVSVHFVDLEEKDPAEIGFERMCEIIRNTREMTSEDLMKEQIELLW